MSKRTKQISNSIRSELVSIARTEIHDPKLQKVGMITFSNVDLSPDLRNGTVWVSFMGKKESDKDVQEALEALNRASGFIHRLLIKRIPIKIHPHLLFKYDAMFDNAATVSIAFQSAESLEKETSEYRKSHTQDATEEDSE
ncbi:MAG: 30S ribosome-binding factor RbfA [Oligoflexia bacterium]|nr:30S ribosome-binding factor RbfA [Oligoflexia bacterium]